MADELRAAADYHGSPARVRELLAAGADPNATPAGSDSALCYAAMYDHRESVRLLVDAGADVRHVGSYGRTPLHYARCPEVAELLIDRGADLAARHDGNDDPLHDHVTTRDDPATARVLIARGLPLVRYRARPEGDRPPRSHLGWAAFCKRPGVVALLLASGCAADEVDADGDSMLHEAIGCDPPGGNDIAKLLVAAGAPLDARDRWGTPIFARLCERRDAELVALALRHGARPDGAALCAAARAGDVDVVVVLVEAGADLAAVGGGDMTALAAAAHAGRAEVVELLLRCGARTDAVDRAGKTLLHHASHGRDARIAARMLELGCAIDARDGAGVTPLHDAAEHYANDVAALLLARGAAVDPRDRDGRTPLLAAARSSVSIVEALLAHGADLEARGADGRTPLLVAKACGSAAVIAALEAHGANVHAVDAAGMGVAAIAEQREQEDRDFWEHR